MKAALKTTDFDFEFTGSNFSEEEIIAKGHIQLKGKELLSKISNKTIYGDYPMGYTFVTRIYANGKAEGINNVNSQDFGHWTINFKTNTLQLEWQNGWVNTLTRAYAVNGNIEFYDVDTGKWRTTFKKFENWKEEE